MTRLRRPLTVRQARALFGLLLVAAAVAYASPLRQPDCNTGAHYALVQSLAHGSARIDRTHGESCDISWWHGHFYVNKAPGLALVTLPWYELLHGLGAIQPNRVSAAPFPHAMRALPRRDLWLVGLWGAVLPALGLLVLVRWAADRLQPGTGIVVAAALGFATLLLPFASLFFSHALAAFLAFAAFAAVLGSRRGDAGRAAAAGVLAGLGIVVEYPLALFAVVLGAYVAAGAPHLRRGAAYAGGLVGGVLPLVAYDVWAFGSPFHLSYVGAVLVPGVSGHDVLGANSVGFFGLQSPRWDRALVVLFSGRGLLTLAPVLALAAVGLPLLWRRGRAREAAFIGALLVAYVVYNAGYYSPLGGATPGPRLLVCVLGFAALALAPVVRSLPLSFLALLVPSAAILLAAHLTQPLISPPYGTHDWWLWLRSDGYSSTIFWPGGHGWQAGLPAALAALAALAAAARLLVAERRLDVLPALAAAAAWVVAWLLLPSHAARFVGLLAVAAAVGAAALAHAERLRGARGG